MSYDAPPPPPPYGGNPYGMQQQPPRSSSKGTWALVCGILGIVCCGPLGIVAVIVGRQAQREGQPGGTAKAGEILGWIAIALMVLGIIFFLVFSVGRSGSSS
jgi:hypothetical protein